MKDYEPVMSFGEDAAEGYDDIQRFSKTPKEFGKGVPEGIAGPEAANNACVGGALVPMMTLGIPGDTMTAVLMGALLIHGLRPGPMLFAEPPNSSPVSMASTGTTSSAETRS